MQRINADRFKLPESGEFYETLKNTVAPNFTFTQNDLYSAITQVYLYLDGVPTIDENKVLGIEYFNDNNSIQYNYITTKPTLTPIVLNSATLYSDGTLEVSYTNSNSVNVSGLFCWQGGAYHASETFTTGTHTLTETGVPTNNSSCFVGTISATGYNDGSTSNTLTYTVTTLSTIYANGSSTVKVGSTNNIYVSDASGKAIGGITVYSSDTSIFTVSLSSGTLYHVTGVSSGSAKLKCSASGYNDLDVTINVQSASLAAPTASDVTSSANEIDQSLTITDFSFTLYNSNSVAVSYTLALDIGATNPLNHLGTISANSSKVINLNAPGDYSSFQGSLFVTFTASGYESSSLDEPVQA